MTDARRSGSTLREARRAAGLTQKALAERAGTTILTVKRLEHGRHEPLVGTALALARVLDTTVEALFGEQPKEDG